MHDNSKLVELRRAMTADYSAFVSEMQLEQALSAGPLSADEMKVGLDPFEEARLLSAIHTTRERNRIAELCKGNRKARRAAKAKGRRHAG